MGGMLACLVEKGSLGVADVQVATGFGRKASHDRTILSALQLDKLALVGDLDARCLLCAVLQRSNNGWLSGHSVDKALQMRVGGCVDSYASGCRRRDSGESEHHMHLQTLERKEDEKIGQGERSSQQIGAGGQMVVEAGMQAGDSLGLGGVGNLNPLGHLRESYNY